MPSFEPLPRCCCVLCNREETQNPSSQSDPEEELESLPQNDTLPKCCCILCNQSDPEGELELLPENDTLPKCCCILCNQSDPEGELELLPEDDFSTDASYQKLQTYESVDSAANMSPSPQSTENHLPDINPNHPHISESGDRGDSLPKPAPKVVIFTPTPENKSETHRSSSGSLAGETLQRKAYGIDQLLTLGQATNMEHMELRIHPGALAENVFKYKAQNAYSKPQEKTRHRGPSDHSTWTHRSNRSEEEVIFSGREWVNAQKPYREPQNPPKEEFAQQHEGFKRFLKQVASPPHNRVTAGGRIVPAGRSFPPPMLDYGSIETTINQPMSKTLLSVNTNTKFNARVGGTDAQTSSHMLPGQNMVNQNTNPSGPRQLEVAQVQDFSNINRGGFDGNILMGTPMQFPPGIEPLYLLPGGGAVVSLEGMQYRASWNGPQLLLEQLQAPLQVNPSFALTPEHPAMMYAQVVHGSHYPAAVKPVTATETRTSLTSTTGPYASSHFQPSNQVNRKASSEERQRLCARLSDLDKHIALSYHKLTKQQHAELVNERKVLVESIDFMRKNSNEHSTSSSAPIVDQLPATGMRPRQHPGNTDLMGKLVNNNGGDAQATLVNQKPLASSTCLSPDAPPFVPSSTKAGSDHTRIEKPWAPAQSTYPFGNSVLPDSGILPNCGLGIENSKATQATQLTIQKEGQGANGTTSRSEEPPREPLPVVSQGDVEYVDRLGLNSAGEEKLYCSTVQEFQEVIRRVREQAGLYGCKGGQSKDPAYDAEQDIRWAMGDHDRIRLPTSTPDHVANPRPWSWDDSVFNVCVSNDSAAASLNGPPSSTYVPGDSKGKASGADILDDPFSVSTHGRADNSDSDPGLDGVTNSSTDGKYSQYELTAMTSAEDIAKEVKYETRDSEPSAVHLTPKLDRTRGFRDVSNGSAIHTPPKSTKGNVTPQLHRRPYQSCVEDSFGTPTSGRAQVTSQGLSASGKKGKRPYKPDPAAEENGVEDLDRWDRPLNQVWDWGTGRLISLDGRPTFHALEAGFHDQSGRTNDLNGPTKRGGNSNGTSWAPITDSKSRWGPDSDTESLDGRGMPKSWDWVGRRAPKVNIPFAFPKPSSKLVGYVPPENRKNSQLLGMKSPAQLGGSNHFLRGMLKNPHYAYPPMGQHSPSAAEMRLRAQHGAELEKHAARKENFKSDAQRGLEWATAYGPSPSTPSVVGQSFGKHKARSSLASSNFQAHGWLGTTGHNGENFEPKSPHGSQLPVTQSHGGRADHYFVPEVRQGHDGPSHSSRSVMPQYDGGWDGMAGWTRSNYYDLSEPNTNTSVTHLFPPIRTGAEQAWTQRVKPKRA